MWQKKKKDVAFFLFFIFKDFKNDHIINNHFKVINYFNYVSILMATCRKVEKLQRHLLVNRPLFIV